MWQNSAYLLARMDSCHVAMFRFLLEANDNMALFTVLERSPALLKIIFARESKDAVLKILDSIAKSLPVTYENWPLE